MNSAKTLLVVGVLGVVGIGAFFILNSGPPPAEPEGARDWENNQLNVQTDFNRKPNESYATPVDSGAPPGGEAPAWSPPPAGAQGSPPGPPRFGSDTQSNRALDAGGPTIPNFGGKMPSFPNQSSPPRGSDPAGRPVPGASISPTEAPGPKFGSPTSSGGHLDSRTHDPSHHTHGPDTPSEIPDAAELSRGAATGGPVGSNAASFRAAMQEADRQISAGRLDEALRGLTSFYGDPHLSRKDHEQLNSRLDQLAGKVIYSRQHLLMQPYLVQQGDRLEEIARRKNVSWQLLAKINGITDPDRLQPGTELKLVGGPFRAVISLQQQLLTLFYGDRYAGRFPVEVVGTVREASTRVRTKNNANVQTPWIELDNGLRICGPALDPRNARRSAAAPCAVLSQQDVEDIYDILQVQSSSVTILR